MSPSPSRCCAPAVSVDPAKTAEPPQPLLAEGGGPSSPPRRRASIDWRNLGFLVSVHVLALAGLVAYSMLHPLTLSACALGLVGTALTVFSISAGYHRLFAHGAYETGAVFRGVLLVLGAAAFQTSAITWASAHRRHHRYVDTDADPYNAKRGFWYSHVGWVIEHTEEPPERVPVPDLERDPLLRWQHRFAIPIGAVSGLLLPWAIGFLLGDPWGGLLFGGLLRLVVTYHLTFSINSLVHKFGEQPYSERSTARDSLLAAVLTMGEGYHNYHHTFPTDYRNGGRCHQFDPTKWILWTFARLGIAKNLKRTPASAIARARLRMDQRRVARRGIPNPWSERVEQASRALHQILMQWSSLSQQRRLAIRAGGHAASRRRRGTLERQLRIVRRSFRSGYRNWQTLLKSVERERSTLSRTGKRMLSEPDLRRVAE